MFLVVRRSLALSLLLALTSFASADGFSGDGFGTPGFFQQGVSVPTVPSWVPAGAQMFVDFPNNRAWDGIAQITTTPDTLLSDTRAASVPYDPGTSITTTIAPNTLPTGSFGLQVFQNNLNYIFQSGGNYTATGWITAHTTVALPTLHNNNPGCTVSQQAPDGSCNTTEITFPSITGGGQSAVQQLVSGLTTGATYTYSVWIKNSSTTANPQTYLSIQQGATPFFEVARTFVAPGSTWQRYSLTFTVPATFTAMYVEIGNTVSAGVQSVQGSLGGGTIEAWVAQVVPGTVPGPYVPTTTSQATTAALDNITATGNLATALATSAGAVAITTHDAGNAVAGTELDTNGTILLGKNSTDHIITALGATLASKAQGNFAASEQGYLSWNGSGGKINVNGTATVADATARTPATPFHIGTTSGTTAPLNGYINTIAVYGTAVSPPLIASVPLTGVVLGTVATLSSGTLQGGAPSTFVNGDSWNGAADAAGNVWHLCNDCGFGNFFGNGGNVILSEASWTSGTPGYPNLGNATGGPPGATNYFSTTLGGYATFQASTHDTWKSCGLIAISDGAATDLFAGLVFDSYATAAPWIQNSTGATITSVVATAAGTTGSYNGMPPGPPVLPISTPTFPTAQFGSPCFVQYAPGYVNSTLPTPNPDNSGSYLYAVSNDVAWNTGNNIYLARIPLSTILTSLGGTLAAASTGSNWQYYISTGCAGGDGTNNSCWTSTLASATPIFTMANKLGRSAMIYLPATNRYLLSSWYYPTLVGPISGSQTQGVMATASEFEFIDCAKPWSCTSVVSSPDFGAAAYYNPTIEPSSLATDGGLTATSIFTGNFTMSQAFSSAAVYTPTMGQLQLRY